MAQALIVEEESGTCQGWVHPHNGYYAGDFSGRGNATFETGSSSSSHGLHLVAACATPSTVSTGGQPGDQPSNQPRAA